MLPELDDDVKRDGRKIFLDCIQVPRPAAARQGLVRPNQHFLCNHHRIFSIYFAIHANTDMMVIALSQCRQHDQMYICSGVGGSLV